MANNTDIKNALSQNSNAIGLPARTVGNAALVRLQAWFESEYAAQLDGASATADDFAAFLGDILARKVMHYEEGLRAAANAEPAVAEFDSEA